MHILDLFLNESPQPGLPGYTNEKDDNTPMKLSDLRKTRLTLAHLNRLRMANDVRSFEQETKMKTVQKQYKPAPEGGDMGGGMMPGL